MGVSLNFEKCPLYPSVWIGNVSKERRKLGDKESFVFRVFAEGVEGLLLELDVCFKGDVGRAALIIEKPPTRPSEQVVDQDPRFRFFHHSFFYRM